MTTRRRRFWPVAAALALTLGLGACSGFSSGSGSNSDDGGGSDNGSGSGTDATTTVSLMTWASPQDRKLYQKSLDKLTDKTGIHVKIVYVGSAAQYFQKINSMVLSNTLPDVFWCNNLNASFQPLAASGKLYDWGPYLDGSKKAASGATLDPDKFGPGYLQQYKVDGKQYGIPNESNTYGVFYNADMFEKAGLPLPTADWTWDDLFKDMAALTETKGGKVTQYGMQTGWGDLYDPVGLSIYALSNGGKALSSKYTSWKGVKEFTADATLRAGVKRWVEAIDKGWVTNPDFTATSTWAAFTKGKVPMVWGGQWNAVAIFDGHAKMKWGFAPIPRGTAKQLAPLEANGFCSPKGVNDPDAAWTVIANMLTTVFNDAYSQDPVAPIAYLPGSDGYFENLEGHGAIGKQVVKTVRGELENDNKVGTGFLDPWASKAANLIKSDWNPMLEGKKPVDPTLDHYVEQVNKLIASGS